MKIELITWADATSMDPWTEISEAKELRPFVMHSVGFILDEDKERVIIALTWDWTGDSVSQFLAIPKGWIKDRQIIKPKRAPKKASK